MGGKDGHAGVIQIFSRFAGTCGQKGGSLRPSCAAVPLAPTTCSKEKVYMLGKGCGHVASASELNLGQFGARGGASRGRVLPILPFDHKSRGYTPFDYYVLSCIHSNVGVFCSYASL